MSFVWTRNVCRLVAAQQQVDERSDIGDGDYAVSIHINPGGLFLAAQQQVENVTLLEKK